jgi:hypothetical protein
MASFLIIYDSSLLLNLSLLLNQILACAAPNATLSEQQTERIKSSGLGMTTKWSPQEFILNHPVLHPHRYLSIQYLEFYRQLDGSLRMEVLIVLLNLLRAVSPCKDFRSDLQLISVFTFFF